MSEKKLLLNTIQADEVKEVQKVISCQEILPFHVQKHQQFRALSLYFEQPITNEVAGIKTTS
jgi:hypothetical protein